MSGLRGQYQGHSAFVDKWIDAAGRGLSCAELIDLHQRAIRALWQASRSSVSDVTLDAVLERVVINARDHFPWLPPLPVVNNSLDVSILRAQCLRMKASQVKKALGFIITEFMAINANMTAETLTPPMHRELAKIRGKKSYSTPKRNGENAK